MIMCRILHPLLLGLLATLMLSGCTAYNPEDHYDPNAVEKIGLITSKSLAKIEKLPAKPKGEFLSIPLNGAIRTIYIPSTDKPRYREIYEYVVEVSDNEYVSILDLYSAYNVGDCAKVFISPKASYPRIAAGSGCPAKVGQSAIPLDKPLQAKSLQVNPLQVNPLHAQLAHALRVRSENSAADKAQGSLVQPKIPLAIGFANLSGAEMSTFIAEDVAALSDLFEIAEVAPTHLIPQTQILFVYAHMNENGSLSGKSNLGVRKLAQISRAPIIVVASPNSGESITKAAKLPEMKSAAIIYTLDRKNDGFSRFFRELFIKMKDGKPLLNAWVELAPQNPQATPAYVPQMILMTEGGNYSFPKSSARVEYPQIEPEMRNLQNLNELAQCSKDARCIRVAVTSNQYALEYTKAVIDKIRFLGATVPPVEENATGEQSVKIRVKLAADGAIKSILTVKLSNNKMMNRWAYRLLIHAAPFHPFDQHLRESADAMVMDIALDFDGNKLISVNSETSEARLHSEIVHEQNNQERR
jgi:hypothetical protein